VTSTVISVDGDIFDIILNPDLFCSLNILELFTLLFRPSFQSEEVQSTFLANIHHGHLIST